MDWPTLIREIQSRNYSFQQIADEVGMSKGGVHDLKNGKAKSVIFESGMKLVALHKRVMRRKVKA